MINYRAFSPESEGIMEYNVNVLTFLFALGREGGVFAALHAAPVFPGEILPVRVEVAPFGPMNEPEAAEYLERLREAFPEAL
jgi:hypothetical protein